MREHLLDHGQDARIQIRVFCAAATSRAQWSDLAIPQGERKRVVRLGGPPHFAAPERSRLTLNTLHDLALRAGAADARADGGGGDLAA